MSLDIENLRSLSVAQIRAINPNIISQIDVANYIPIKLEI